jgi:hypothetical protein
LLSEGFAAEDVSLGLDFEQAERPSASTKQRTAAVILLNIKKLLQNETVLSL